jgi:predicted unusual protein kinase regulating ubiquinone biosynthesis (AarF/ABC1/UbiB family)
MFNYTNYAEELGHISDTVLEAILAHGDKGAVKYFLPLYILKLSASGQLSAETVLRVSRLYSAEMTNNLKSDKRLASESLGYEMSLRDYAYLVYFKHEGLCVLQNMPTGEALVWLEKYMPDKSPYRDIVLNKIFKSCFAELADRETQLRIIELFKNKERALEMLAICYAQHSGDFTELAAKINFLNTLYPVASPEKDLLLEEIFSGQSFALTEYNYYLPLFSNSSRNYQQQESIGRGTLGVHIENYAAADKAELVLWLTGKQKTKPACLVSDEDRAKVLLDETKDLFARSRSYRNEMLKEIFAGNKGLFSPDNAVRLQQLLDTLFADYLAESGRDSADDLKLKNFARTVIHELFKLDNNAKKLRILTNIFNRVYTNPDQTLATAEFIKIVLSAYGVVGVKLAQILASQKGLEKTYPQLYAALKDLKDKANAMSIAEALNALNHNPALRECDITIRECRGSASIKSVFSAGIDGEEKIIKIRRASANKDIQKEQAEFQQLMRSLTLDLRNIFGLESVPDYSERIFAAVREEVDFAIERENADKLRAVLSKMNNRNVEFRVPYIDEKLSDKNILVETIAAGMSLAEYRRTVTDAENELLNQILQKAMLEQIFKYGYFHADPHDGNIFVKRENGKYIITFIDVGLCGELAKNSAETKFFRGLILAAVKKDTRPQDYLNLFKTILSTDYQTYAETLDKSIREDLLTSKPENMAVTIVNILDSLPNYRVPDSVVRTLLAVSKTPYLYKQYKANLPLYLELFGFDLLFGG